MIPRGGKQPVNKLAQHVLHIQPLATPAHTPTIRSTRPETHHPAHSLTASRKVQPHTIMSSITVSNQTTTCTPSSNANHMQVRMRLSIGNCCVQSASSLTHSVAATWPGYWLAASGQCISDSNTEAAGQAAQHGSTWLTPWGHDTAQDPPIKRNILQCVVQRDY